MEKFFRDYSLSNILLDVLIAGLYQAFVQAWDEIQKERKTKNIPSV